MKLTFALVAAALSAQPALASPPTRPGPFAVSYDVGALMGVGGHDDLVDHAVLIGLTASYEISPWVSVVASFGRARADADGLWDAGRSVLQLDLGVQGQVPFAVGRDVFLVPFGGMGLGARTSDFRDRRGRRDTDPVGYVAAGARAEVSFGMLAVTVRDYVSADDASGSGRTSLRQDLAVFASAGVRF